MKTLVLCENKSCIHYIFKEDEGPAYQNQCGNDEIEIGLNEENEPVCYTEEERDRDIE